MDFLFFNFAVLSIKLKKKNVKNITNYCTYRFFCKYSKDFHKYVSKYLSGSVNVNIIEAIQRFDT